VQRELVPVGTFRSRLEAEMAKGLLEAHGIPSYVSADDAGGMNPPALQCDLGVRLIVRSLDLIPARRLLWPARLAVTGRSERL
jgi:hypothetical protein